MDTQTSSEHAKVETSAIHRFEPRPEHGSLTGYRAAEWAAALRSRPSEALVLELCAAVERDRQATSLVQWKAQAASLRSSELGALCAEDPMTAHALRRPRGYAGDAALIDRIYFGLRADYAHDAKVTPLGRLINRAVVSASCGEGARARRVLLARTIDEEAARAPGLRIASIACGYLREANLSRAFAEGRVGRFTCLDQDVLSARELAFRYEGNPAVRPLTASIGRLIAGSLTLDQHDLIYASGLYDYLDARAARMLTSKLIAALAPGGRLLIGNYAAGASERGYLEAFADWWLIYRDPVQLRALIDDSAAQTLASISIRSCATGSIHYLDVRKR